MWGGRGQSSSSQGLIMTVGGGLWGQTGFGFSLRAWMGEGGPFGHLGPKATAASPALANAFPFLYFHTEVDPWLCFFFF